MSTSSTSDHQIKISRKVIVRASPVYGFIPSNFRSFSSGVYASFIEGYSEVSNHLPSINPRGYSATKSISTTSTTIFSIINKEVYNGRTNQSEIELELLTLSSESTKTTIVDLIANPTVSGSENWQDIGTNLMSEIDISGTTVSGGTLLASFNVTPGRGVTIDLNSLAVRLPPTLKLTIAARVTSGPASDVTASLTWLEEI